MGPGRDPAAAHVPVELERLRDEAAPGLRLLVRFRPDAAGQGAPRLRLGTAADRGDRLVMRLYRPRPRHAGRSLERCLRSLEMRAGAPPERIHIVASPRSAAANRNEGFARTTQPWVCFLDDDVELPAGFSLAPLLAALGAGRTGLAAPKILDPDRAIFCADPCFDVHLTPRPRGLGEPDHGQYDYVRDAPWLPATFLLVRRRAFDAAGGFSEEFAGSQVEDVDFCLKARVRGYRCTYVGTTSVLHRSLQRNDCYHRNSALLRERWTARLAPPAGGLAHPS